MMVRGWGGLLALVCAWSAFACSDSEKGPNATAGTGASTGSNNAGQGGASGSSAGSAGSGGSSGESGRAGIQTRFPPPAESSSGLNHLLAFAGGGAVRPGLESLEYYIFSVQICESLEA